MAFTWDSALSGLNGAGAVAVVWAFFLCGLAGTLVPVLPGVPLVWCGILIDKLWMGEASVSWTFVAVTGAATLLTLALDYALNYWGVKRFGGTWRGGLGAIVGLFVGLFLPPPLLWILLGPIVGAIAGEMLGGSSIGAASKAGAGMVVGALAAFVLKIAIALAMIAAFCILR